MQHEIGDYVIGTVIKVKPFALFLRLEDGTEGLLHISEISDSYIRDIEKFGKIGDLLKVKIISKDANNGFLRFSFKQVPQEESFSSHIASKKGEISYSENDFDELKEKLPEWISNTLNKIKEEDK